MAPPPPLSRQQSCGECGHEEHTFFNCEWCLCEAHLPPGDPRRPENKLTGCIGVNEEGTYLEGYS